MWPRLGGRTFQNFQDFRFLRNAEGSELGFEKPFRKHVEGMNVDPLG